MQLCTATMESPCAGPSPAPAAPIPEALAVLAARPAVALEASLARFLAAPDQNLGPLETQAAHDVQELLRPALPRAAQATKPPLLRRAAQSAVRPLPGAPPAPPAPF